MLDKIVDIDGVNIYEPIEIPLFHMTGTDDSSPIGDLPYTHRLKVFEQSGHGEKYLLIKDDADHMIYNGTRGKLERNLNRELHEEIIKVLSLAFWEAKLKGDRGAMEWIQGQAVREYLSGQAEIKIST